MYIYNEIKTMNLTGAYYFGYYFYFNRLIITIKTAIKEDPQIEQVIVGDYISTILILSALPI